MRCGPATGRRLTGAVDPEAGACTAYWTVSRILQADLNVLLQKGLGFRVKKGYINHRQNNIQLKDFKMDAQERGEQR